MAFAGIGIDIMLIKYTLNLVQVILSGAGGDGQAAESVDATLNATDNST